MEFELPQDFKELFESLNANNVQYLLIGGYAVGVYGYARSTNDIDIFVSSDPENVQNLVKAIVQFGFAGVNLTEKLFSQGRSIVEMGVEPMKIQLMNFADGIDFLTAYARRNEVNIEGVMIDTIDKSDLIRNKIASGRYKDLADVERLKRME